MSLNISCIGKWILYHLGSPDESARTVIITIIATLLVLLLLLLLLLFQRQEGMESRVWQEA